MRGEEDGEAFAGDVRDDGLQDFFGDGGVEARGGFIEDGKVSTAAECEKQTKFGTDAAGKTLDARGVVEAKLAAIPLLQIRTPTGIEAGREVSDFGNRHI